MSTAKAALVQIPMNRRHNELEAEEMILPATVGYFCGWPMLGIKIRRWGSDGPDRGDDGDERLRRDMAMKGSRE
ncbi:hypothetical protein J3F83DRAFT_1274 [Trichoderma novae-zelandiae]